MADRKWLVAFTLVAVACFSPPAPLEACGPWFPNQLLLDASRSVLEGRVADLGYELEVIARRHRLLGGRLPIVEAGDPRETTERIELEELSELLVSPDDPAVGRRRLLEIEELRRQLREEPSRAKVPTGLPTEVDLYLQGAIAHARGEQAVARGFWERILDLPDAERKRRSTWAAFMIGKTLLMEDDASAALWLSRVRELVADGCDDRLGLAVTALGWEAMALWRLDRPAEGLARYVAQAAHGDPSGTASVAEVMARGLEPWMFEDALARETYTAYLLSRASLGHVTEGLDGRVEPWLAGLEQRGVTAMPGADRLAWLAYRVGDVARTRRWLAKADPESAVTRWVRAKLELRAGHVTRAAELLGEVVAGFPLADPGSDERETSLGLRARAELGLLQLSRGAYVEAADALLEAGAWVDAAYVAERVLTLPELRKLVDERWPEVQGEGRRAVTSGQIRALLGRRLVRAGLPSEALPYRSNDPELLEWVRLAEAVARPDVTAETRWALAQLVRRSGLELMGTEVSPDWAYHGGSFTQSDVLVARRDDRGPLRPRPDELARAKRHRPTHDRRYHYRYVAADLAWEAARGLPDDDPLTAEVLCTAGRWLANEDPQAADRFYKALVRRSPSLPIGHEADVLRWFPATCRTEP
ncbi:MAG: hypothetical protein KC731_09495 [Myxococcales bacterium]|nr:hypothetical protein [Myxococcales bacterium]